MTYRPFPIRGPWKGIVTDVPPPGDPAAFDDVVNFFIRKGLIQGRPKFISLGNPPGTPLGLVSFRDAVGKYHTLYLNEAHAYFVTAGPTYNELVYDFHGTEGAPGFPNPLGSSLPYSTAEILSQVYFCNQAASVSYVDGGTNTGYIGSDVDPSGGTSKIGAQVYTAGDVPGGCQFLAVDGSGTHLLGANWVEPAYHWEIPLSGPSDSPGVPFPQRLRWAASGNPNEWDFNVDPSAGFNDFLELPSAIDGGMQTIGFITYIGYKTGFTVVFPSGQSPLPFTFEDLTRAPFGAGSVYPYAFDVWKDFGVAIAQEDIYTLSNGVVSPLQTPSAVLKSIFRDLATQTPSSPPVVGKINASLATQYDFLSYWLSIPAAGVVWVFSFKDQNWVRVTTGFGYLNLMNQVVTA